MPGQSQNADHWKAVMAAWLTTMTAQASRDTDAPDEALPAVSTSREPDAGFCGDPGQLVHFQQLLSR